MSETVKIEIGGSIEDDAAAFVNVWERAERGAQGAPSRVLAFESWEAMAGVLTGEPFRLLRHLHGHPEPSVSALSRSLGRHLRRVQADVRALEATGLVDRTQGNVRAGADRLEAAIQL